MVQLILKNEINKGQIEMVLNLLKSWNIDAELKNAKPKMASKKNEFSLAVGIWDNYSINADELRKKMWNRNL